MRLTGLKDDFLLLSKQSNGLSIYSGKKNSNILIFHPIEELMKPTEILDNINDEERNYLFDKLNNEHELVVYIRKLPIIKSCYTLFYHVFDDVLRFVFHSMHQELLEYIKEKAKLPNFKYTVVKDGVMKEVPYF